ncbi:MAG: hypothetical protein VKN33_02185 [Candidatus Sericytochromatia bacterium]|nr:hypothetical protein [Candidatus Sericytochromatia bacterium]
MTHLYVFVSCLVLPFLWGASSAITSNENDLRAFCEAPVGRRLSALGHTPLTTRRLKNGEWAVLIHAPEQSTISNWDDETRVVLYRPGKNDFQRTQFVSRAGHAVPGQTRHLEVRDLDGDDIEELVIKGQPHGPVGKSTVAIYRRQNSDARFYVVFRRRQLNNELIVGPKGVKLRYRNNGKSTIEEIFRWSSGQLLGEDPHWRAVVWQ